MASQARFPSVFSSASDAMDKAQTVSKRRHQRSRRGSAGSVASVVAASRRTSNTSASTATSTRHTRGGRHVSPVRTRKTMLSGTAGNNRARSQSQPRPRRSRRGSAASSVASLEAESSLATDRGLSAVLARVPRSRSPVQPPPPFADVHGDTAELQRRWLASSTAPAPQQSSSSSSDGNARAYLASSLILSRHDAPAAARTAMLHSPVLQKTMSGSLQFRKTTTIGNAKRGHIMSPLVGSAASPPHSSTYSPGRSPRDIALSARHGTPRSTGSSPLRRGPAATAKFSPAVAVLKPADRLHHYGEVKGVDLVQEAARQMDLSAIAAALGGSRFPKGGDPLGSIAARLAEWLCGLGDISVQYKSVALFVQVKLREIETLAGEAENPNIIRTAVTFGLLDVFMRQLVRYAPTLLPLREDLLHAVYVDPEAAAKGAMPIERSRQRGASTVLDADTPEALQVSTEEALGHLLRSETYYTRTKKQAAKLAEEASLLPIRLERVRLQTHIKGKLREADHVARKKRIAKAFYGWAGRMPFRKYKDECDARLLDQLERARRLHEMAKAHKPHLGHIFYLWRYTIAAESKNISVVDLAEAQAHASYMERQVAQERAAHQATLARLGLLQNRYQRLRVRAAAAVTKLTKKVGELRTIISVAGRNLKAMGKSAVQGLQGLVEEVQSAPDARLIQAALARKDLEPERFVKNGYVYAGDGAGSGGWNDGDDMELDEIGQETGYSPRLLASASQHGRSPPGTAGSSAHMTPRTDLLRQHHKRYGGLATSASAGSLRADGTVDPHKRERRGTSRRSPSPFGNSPGTPGSQHSIASGSPTHRRRGRRRSSALHGHRGGGSFRRGRSRSPSPEGHTAAAGGGAGAGAGAIGGGGGRMPSIRQHRQSVGQWEGADGSQRHLGVSALHLPMVASAEAGVESVGEAEADERAARAGLQEFGGAETASVVSMHPAAAHADEAVPTNALNRLRIADDAPRDVVARAKAVIDDMPPDIVLLRWFNYQLSKATFSGLPFTRRVYNFGTDLQDGLCLAALLTQISPNSLSKKTLRTPDARQRSELIVHQLLMMRPTAVAFVAVDDIVGGDTMLLTALVARLFSTHSSLVRKSRAVSDMERRVEELEAELMTLQPTVEAMVRIEEDEDDEEPIHLVSDSSSSDEEESDDDDHDGNLSSSSSDSDLAKTQPVEAVPGGANTRKLRRQRRKRKRQKREEHEALGIRRASQGPRMEIPTGEKAAALAKARPKLDVDIAIKQLARFHRQNEMCLQTVLQETANSREGTAVWASTQHRVNAFTWSLFAARLRGKVEEVVDEREAKQMSEFTELCIPKLQDLLNRHTKNQDDADAQVAAMQKRLLQHRVAVSRIFQFYCASGDGSSISTMTHGEFWQLLKDVRLATQGFGDRKSARIDLIFRKCNQKVGLEDERVNNPDKEFIPREFVESLVRVAVLNVEDRQPQLSVSEAFDELIDEYLLPYAVQANTEMFREGLRLPETVAVFYKHRVSLQRVFAYYAHLKKPVLTSANAPKTMLIGDFMQMLRDTQLLDDHLTPLAAHHVFGHTQLEEAFVSDASIGGGEDAMIYSEFVEGVAALAYYKVCSPYISPARRLDNFITFYLLPKAMQRTGTGRVFKGQQPEQPGNKTVKGKRKRRPGSAATSVAGGSLAGTAVYSMLEEGGDAASVAYTAVSAAQNERMKALSVAEEKMHEMHLAAGMTSVPGRLDPAPGQTMESVVRPSTAEEAARKRAAKAAKAKRAAAKASAKERKARKQAGATPWAQLQAKLNSSTGSKRSKKSRRSRTRRRDRSLSNASDASNASATSAASHTSAAASVVSQASQHGMSLAQRRAEARRRSSGARSAMSLQDEVLKAAAAAAKAVRVAGDSPVAPEAGAEARVELEVEQPVLGQRARRLSIGAHDRAAVSDMLAAAANGNATTFTVGADGVQVGPATPRSTAGSCAASVVRSTLKSRGVLEDEGDGDAAAAATVASPAGSAKASPTAGGRRGRSPKRALRKARRKAKKKHGRGKEQFLERVAGGGGGAGKGGVVSDATKVFATAAVGGQIVSGWGGEGADATVVRKVVTGLGGAPAGVRRRSSAVPLDDNTGAGASISPPRTDAAGAGDGDGDDGDAAAAMGGPRAATIGSSSHPGAFTRVEDAVVPSPYAHDPPWRCKKCGMDNAPGHTACEVCGEGRRE